MQAYGPIPYRAEEADAVRAARVAMRVWLRRPTTRRLIVAVVVVAILLLVLDVVDDGYLNLASTAALVLGLPLVWLTLFLSVPRHGRRQYRQSPALRDEHWLSFDENSLTIGGSRGTIRLPFDDFREMAISPDVILLYQTEAYYNLFPRRMLGEAGDILVARLRAAGVRQV